MTITAHNKRRVYSGATKPNPLAPPDGRKRPRKRAAPPLRPSPLDRLHPKKHALAHAAVQDFLAYARLRKSATVEVSAPEVAPVALEAAPPKISEKEKVRAWLISSGPATAAQIAAGCGLGQGSHASRALRGGIPGVGVVDTVDRAEGGKPVKVWGVVDDGESVST